jgi:hypothetical protein
MIVPTPQGPTAELRRMAFARTAQELGLNATDTGPVWGVIMEIGFSEALVSLVVFAEGSTSLYFGNGGGIIGAGEHASVRKAAGALLSVASINLKDMTDVKSPELPQVGEVRFYSLTYTGIRSASAIEDELGAGGHRLSQLFYAAQNVITAVRESSIK